MSNSNIPIVPIEEVTADLGLLAAVAPAPGTGVRWVNFRRNGRPFNISVEGVVHSGVRPYGNEEGGRKDNRASFTVLDDSPLGHHLVPLFQHVEDTVLAAVHSAKRGDPFFNSNKDPSGWHTTVYGESAKVDGKSVAGEPHNNPYVRMSLAMRPEISEKQRPTQICDESKPYLKKRGDPKSLAFREYKVDGRPIDATNVHRAVTRGSTFTAILSVDVSLSKFAVGIRILVRSMTVKTAQEVDAGTLVASAMSDAKREAALRQIAEDEAEADDDDGATVVVPNEDDEDDDAAVPGEGGDPAAASAFLNSLETQG